MDVKFRGALLQYLGGSFAAVVSDSKGTCARAHTSGSQLHITGATSMNTKWLSSVKLKDTISQGIQRRRLPTSTPVLALTRLLASRLARLALS